MLIKLDYIPFACRDSPPVMKLLTMDISGMTTRMMQMVERNGGMEDRNVFNLFDGEEE